MFRTGTDKWAVFFLVVPLLEVQTVFERAQKKLGISTKVHECWRYWRHLIQLGYNLVVLPYCSSDLYQGDHLQIIGGKKSHLAVLSSKAWQINWADFSGLRTWYLWVQALVGFKPTLTTRQFKSTRLILDSFWFDKVIASWYTKDYPRVRPGRVKFQFKIYQRIVMVNLATADKPVTAQQAWYREALISGIWRGISGWS